MMKDDEIKFLKSHHFHHFDSLNLIIKGFYNFSNEWIGDTALTGSNLAKVEVASSNLVSRSSLFNQFLFRQHLP